MKIKGLIFIGSRANYGRLYMVLKEMQKNKDWLDFKIFSATAGTYLQLEEFAKYVDYKVDGLMYRDDPYNMAFTVSTILEHAGNYLEYNKYDFCFIHGDRYECLGMATACLFNSLKVVHSEGGEFSGSYDNTVRYMISQMAYMHFSTSSKSYSVLNYMFNSLKVYNVGSPVVDLVFNVLERRRPRNEDERYIVVLYNPLVGENYMELVRAVKVLARQIRVVWVNPNMDPGNKKILKDVHDLDIEFMKNVPVDEFIRLLDHAHLLLGNTSSGIKEGAVVGIPYILVGNRQINRETTKNVVRVKMDEVSIVELCDIYLSEDPVKFAYDNTFGIGDSSRQMLAIIEDEFKKK
jgi:UDP-hydrolysing UDP-N-acetyl-D-glucosamine 2-epimerase